MVKCDYCEEEISYLPFKCRHCGSSFCKKHRIAENHECNFQFINDPYHVKKLKSYEVPVAYTDSTQGSYGDFSSRNYNANKGSKNKNNIPRGPSMMSLLGLGRKPKTTYILIIINIVFFIITSLNFFDYFIYLSLGNILSAPYLIYTIFTAMFVPGDVLSLIFNCLIIWMMGKIIEGRFGPKTYLKLYIISGIFAGLTCILFQLIFFNFEVSVIAFNSGVEEELIYLVSEYPFYETTSGAIMGLMTFMLMLLPQGEIMLFGAFRLKTKNFLWGFIGLYVILGLFSLIEQSPSFIINFSSIFGVFGALIIKRTLFKSHS